MTRRALVGAVLVAALSSSLAAQEVRGTIRDSDSGQPIPGAVLTLLDSAGTTLGRTITDPHGQFRVALSMAAHRFRVVRIGFRPRDVSMPDPVDGVAHIDLAMTPIPTLLEPVHVRDDPRCSRRNDRAAALGLWEQARAGLLAAVVARQLAPANMRRLTFDRVMDAGGDRAVSQRVAIDSITAQPKPFGAAHSGADFVRVGFAEEVGQDLMFYAPDADVLLDEDFARSYCFHIVDPDRARPRQIGLGFTSAISQRNRIDVEGALWIDTVSRALSEIEFRYTGLNRTLDRYRPGGQVLFRDMPNGLVVVDRWTLRLVATRVEPGTPVSRFVRTAFTVTETGGEIGRAQWPDGTVWTASLGELRIHAIHGDAPAPGTKVALSGTDYRATANASGDLAIRDLVPGPYTVVIVDSVLAPVRLRLVTPLTFVATRDSVSTFALQVPTAEDYVAAACQADRKPIDAPGWLLARVMRADSTPVEGVKWSLRRLELPDATALSSPAPDGDMLRTGGKTGASGLLEYCGNGKQGPALGSTVEIRVWRDGAPAIAVRVELRDRVTVVPIFWTAP